MNSNSLRGGGPFGAGRLKGLDLQQLESSLLAAVRVLREDSKLAGLDGLGVSSPSVGIADSSPSTKKPSSPHAEPARETVVMSAARPVTSDTSPATTPMASPLIQESGDVDEATPIAIGLDRFLQSPATTSYEVGCTSQIFPNVKIP